MSDGLFIYITLALLVGGITALYHITVKPLFQLIRKWMKRSESKGESDNNAINEKDNQTRDLLLKTLGDIGCQYEIDENNYIVFKYQGEEFKIDASNDSHIILIYGISWHSHALTFFAHNIPNSKENLISSLDGFFMAQRPSGEYVNLTKNQKQEERIEIKGFK